MIYKGYNPDILTQKFFEELLFNVYPNRKINSIYPWAGDLKVDNNDKVYFGNCSLKNDGTTTALFLNGSAFYLRNGNPVHFPVCFDSVDDDDLVYFVGFVAQMDNVPMALVDETAPINPDYTLKVFKPDLCYHCLDIDGTFKVVAFVNQDIPNLYVNSVAMDKISSGVPNLFEIIQPFGVPSILTHQQYGRLQYDLGTDFLVPVTAKKVSSNEIQFRVKIRTLDNTRNIPDSHTNYFGIWKIFDSSSNEIYSLGTNVYPFNTKLSENFGEEYITHNVTTLSMVVGNDYFAEIWVGFDYLNNKRIRIKIDN